MRYIETIEGNLLRFVAEKHQTRYFFQQDNASIHTAKVTKDRYASNNTNFVSSPARISDLNPVQNVWGKLNRAFYRALRQYNSVEYLKASILREQANVDRGYIYSLFRGMQKRCFDIIELKGGKTADWAIFLVKVDLGVSVSVVSTSPQVAFWIFCFK